MTIHIATNIKQEISMAKPHLLEIHLVNGQVHKYEYASVTEVDSVRSALLRELLNNGVLSLITEDGKLLVNG